MTQVETAAPPTTATKIANPGPLGLCGFALTTLVLSLANSGLSTGFGASSVIPLAIAFGGGAQLLAGMWEFRTGNTFGATAFSGFGAFWISFALLFLLGSNPAVHSLAAPNDVATYLLGWTIFTGVLTLGAFRVNGVTGSLFSLLLLTFAALTAGEYMNAGGGDGSLFHHIGGFLGIVTAINAFYNAAAGILKDLAGKDVLPVFGRK